MIDAYYGYHAIIRSGSVIYCCVTNYPKFSILKQQTFTISVGQELVCSSWFLWLMISLAHKVPITCYPDPWSVILRCKQTWGRFASKLTHKAVDRSQFLTLLNWTSRFLTGKVYWDPAHTQGEVIVCACSVVQSCLTLCNTMDCSPPGSSDHGIFQARILEWAAISTSRRSSQSRDRTCVSC